MSTNCPICGCGGYWSVIRHPSGEAYCEHFLPDQGEPVFKPFKTEQSLADTEAVLSGDVKPGTVGELLSSLPDMREWYPVPRLSDAPTKEAIRASRASKMVVAFVSALVVAGGWQMAAFIERQDDRRERIVRERAQEYRETAERLKREQRVTARYLDSLAKP